jgi:hypothetical protein
VSWRHTDPERWLATLRTLPVVTRSVGHEVSKPKAAGASWKAERMGPTIMAAPHRGHAHVVRVGCLSRRRRRTGGCRRRRCGEQGPCEGDARRSAGVRQESRLANAYEAAREDVLNEAAQKLHGGERHRATLVAMGVVLGGEGHVVAIEGEQPVRDPEECTGGRRVGKRTLR